jgi:SOS-response transcriptional repressor LexA
MNYAELLSSYIEKSELSLGEVARRIKEQKGVKVDRSYISKLKNGDVNPPSDEISEALAAITGGDPVELIWAATVEKSHPLIQQSLAKIDVSHMKHIIELEKKYPIPEHFDDIEADKFIESIPEYKKAYDNFIADLDNHSNPNELIDIFNTLYPSEEKMLLSVHESSTELYKAGNLKRVPVIGTVAAGPNGIAFEEYLGTELVEESTIKGDDYFFLKIKGDSMIGDGILPGDMALIKKTPQIEYGDIAVVIVNGEEGTIKRVYQKDDSVILQSSNPNHPPRVFRGDELNHIRIVGKVKQTIRKY